MIEIRSRIVCDGCGAVVEGRVGFSTTRAYESYVDADVKAKRAGWTALDHGRYYKRRHFCPACADKPLPKLKALPR